MTHFKNLIIISTHHRLTTPIIWGFKRCFVPYITTPQLTTHHWMMMSSQKLSWGWWTLKLWRGARKGFLSHYALFPTNSHSLLLIYVVWSERVLQFSSLSYSFTSEVDCTQGNYLHRLTTSSTITAISSHFWIETSILSRPTFFVLSKILA
jgi:hypothetical protein